MTVEVVKPYRRVVLKLSGEVLKGSRPAGVDPQYASQLAGEIAEARGLGVEMLIVIGGGNMFRGAQDAPPGMNRSAADAVGMLATVMNSIMMAEALRGVGVEARVLSAIPMRAVCDPWTQRDAVAHLSAGRVVLAAGGTGNPFFSTDSAAALRAGEIEANAVLKATKVDGVYTADPAKDPTARRLERVSFDEALSRDLRVMDASAFALCRESGIPIVVFNLSGKGNIARVLKGEPVGTLVGPSAGDAP